MKTVFFGEDGRLRNGWWVLVFLVILAGGVAGLQVLIPFLGRHGVHASGWVPWLLLVYALGATWFCQRLRGETMAGAGFALGRRWAREAFWGTLLGMGLMVAAAAMLWVDGGVTWSLNPARSLASLGWGALILVRVALFEESLFRGFLFQRMVGGMGAWPAQAVLALLFAFAHWGNPGMHGAIRFWATLNISLAAGLLGLAYLRTRSLALPVGIHLGWNWAQGHLLGFAVSGTGQGKGWVLPVFHGKPDWISGGAFGLEASVFGVVAVALAIGFLWRWKGRGEAPCQ